MIEVRTIKLALHPRAQPQGRERRGVYGQFELASVGLARAEASDSEDLEHYIEELDAR